MSEEQGGYQGSRITAIVEGVILSGKDDGEFCKAKYEKDKVEAFEGADGYVAYAEKPAMRLGEIELTIAQTSLSNNELRIVHALPKSLNIAVLNQLGGEVVSMPRGKLKKEPEIVYSNKIAMRKYVYVGQMIMVPAGFAAL